MMLVVADARVIRSERSTSCIPHGLNSPCGPSYSDAPRPFMPVRLFQGTDVLPIVDDVQGIINRLRDQYERIPLPEIYSEEVIGLPGPEEISTSQNVTIDYIIVSHLLVFVDIVCTDNRTPFDIVHSHRRALWEELRLGILNLLCSMHVTMVQTPHVSNDITLPCVREASCNGQRSIFARNRRNFVIASAVRDVFSRLQHKYNY
ncbi:uncharacterized protein LOC117339983 [Pecten maximus]|uniref:uncharacterized protein LOC117339983 n=1 Tax=Pecten maximus TaxID=6579 RepID=UPI00145897D4|nr:uncharacterized protein LOC117339983 [Pecten maximus]